VNANGCGTCTLCCKLLAVDELEKPACSWCKLADPRAGCTAYATRPQSCRDFACVWLQSQARPEPLPESMRPDRSRVVLDTMTDGSGLVAHVDPDRPDAHESGPVGRLLAHALGSGLRVVVATGGRRTLLRAGPQP